MTVWLAFNTLAIALLGGVLFLVIRQLGFVLQRAGAVSARGTNEGPRVGENLSPHLGVSNFADGRPKLIVFMSESCSVCRLVRQGADELANVWNRDAEILLVYDCDEGNDRDFESISPGLRLARSFSLRQRLEAKFVPFAVVTDPQGVVIGKGLVNDITHLESLLELEKSKRSTSPETPQSDSQTGLVMPTP